jgi:hypothetical protein
MLDVSPSDAVWSVAPSPLVEVIRVKVVAKAHLVMAEFEFLVVVLIQL